MLLIPLIKLAFLFFDMSISTTDMTLDLDHDGGVLLSLDLELDLDYDGGFKMTS